MKKEQDLKALMDAAESLGKVKMQSKVMKLILDRIEGTEQTDATVATICVLRSIFDEVSALEI
jgi:hypothetical protein